MPPSKNIDLMVETSVLTTGTVAEIAKAIAVFFLYQRQQIPFPYKTFKYYVESWADKVGNDNAEAMQLQTLHLERQRELAKKTKEDISAMREVITKTLENNVVKSLRFLFGTTTFTAKESYTIHIPIDRISHSHYSVNHSLSSERINKILLPLVIHEGLYTLFSLDLVPTNLYLELELLDDCRNSPAGNIFAKKIGQLPPSCKDVHIYLKHKLPNDFNAESLSCCGDLQIFEDLRRLSISQDTLPVKQTDHRDYSMEEENSTSWWEAEVVVRAFKEKPSKKGMSIWG